MGIRLAGPGDRTAVEKIVVDAYTPWIDVIGMKPVPMLADYGRLIADERVHVLENGEIDALIVLVPEDDTLYVDNVAVRPDRQGRGLGRRLMAFAEHRARDLGLPALRLVTNVKMLVNIALYESLGYRVTGPALNRGRSVVQMRKEL